MDRSFTLFPKLPPELRQKIWRAAYEQDWSFTHPKRVKRSIKFFGKSHRAVGQTCRESRAVMQARQTSIEALRWVDFGHHIFFFRDASDDLGLMKRGLDRFHLLEHIQHMVIYPRSLDTLWDTLENIKDSCKSLRNLVIIGPWFDPGPLIAAGRDDLISLALSHPFDAWEPSSHETFSEVDVHPLIEAFENCDAAARSAQLKANIEEGMRRMPPVLDEEGAMYTACGFTERWIAKIEEIAKEFLGGTPDIYFRTKHELCPLTVFIGNGDLRVPDR